MIVFIVVNSHVLLPVMREQARCEAKLAPRTKKAEPSPTGSDLEANLTCSEEQFPEQEVLPTVEKGYLYTPICNFATYGAAEDDEDEGLPYAFFDYGTE